MITKAKVAVPDPEVPDWGSINLPDAWPDRIHFASLEGIRRFWLSKLAGKRARVQLPENVFVGDVIPKYALQEFHGLPNGFYSQRITRGYIKGFEYSMLGILRAERKWIADTLRPAISLLDAGCGAGWTAAAMVEAGAADVWGLDPSSYMLKHAALDFDSVSFVPGVIEDMPFRNERFDGVGVCFVFHEVPPRYIRLAFQEISRVLKPGGRLAVVEPSPQQMYQSAFRMFRDFGWKGLYFKYLARVVFEPFIESWHKFDVRQALNDAGLALELDEQMMPVRRILAVKKDGA